MGRDLSLSPTSRSSPAVISNFSTTSPGRRERRLAIRPGGNPAGEVQTAGLSDREHVMTEQPSTDPLSLLSDDLARHVAAIGAGVVAVHGRHGPPFSGFVWRRSAIVTAEEALEADEGITITVPDGRRIGATLAGRDPTTDVAVLRVTGSEDLAPLVASARSDLGAGHLALAVGRRPEGVIAHLGGVSVVGGPWRSMRGGHIARFLRLDLRLDDRAEGGALVDLRDGRAFGMAVYGPRGSVLGIPMETIEHVAERLLAHGRIGPAISGWACDPYA